MNYLHFILLKNKNIVSKKRRVYRTNRNGSLQKKNTLWDKQVQFMEKKEHFIEIIEYIFQ